MSYDLHIVRTHCWLDADEKPIAKSAVDTLIENDDELEWSATNWVDMVDDETGEVIRYFMIEWNGRACFWWHKNEITCSGPDEEQIRKLTELAEGLSAFVIGDDGEHYPPHSVG